MVLVLECVIICFILLVPCVVSIANGIEQAAFLFEADVQDRVVEMGLVTRERLRRNQRIFKTATLLVMLAFAVWAVYGINGARGFWSPFWQIYAITMAEGLFDRFFYRLVLGGAYKSLDDSGHGRPQTLYPQENTD